MIGSLLTRVKLDLIFLLYFDSKKRKKRKKPKRILDLNSGNILEVFLGKMFLPEKLTGAIFYSLSQNSIFLCLKTFLTPNFDLEFNLPNIPRSEFLPQMISSLDKAGHFSVEPERVQFLNSGFHQKKNI